MRNALWWLVCVCLLALGGVAQARGPCQPDWESWGGPPGLDSAVNALVTWDPDGDGPIPAQLVAGGSFNYGSGVTLNRIARWDGLQWTPFGSGMNGTVKALTTWDPDGDGPLPPQLVAGGNFTTAGGVTVNGIARWDGTQWLPFGAGMNGEVLSLISWDPDGDGPLPAQLVAGGSFTQAGGLTVNRIARWDGTQWLPLGPGMASSVHALILWDPDGEGPLPAQLVAGGTFGYIGTEWIGNIARWDGRQWLPFGPHILMSGGVLALTTWDPDGDGPLPAQLVAGGSFITAGSVTVNGIARWDGTQWLPLGAGLTGTVKSLTTWDPDGPGPLPAQLVVGGDITSAAGIPVRNMVTWDGVRWAPMGTGLDREVYSLATWDPDGPGPLPAQVYAGGLFHKWGALYHNQESMPNRKIARWDGAQWQTLGMGMDAAINSLITWDPDGDGPLPAQLIAAGNFGTAGSMVMNRIARWDGTQWRPFALGIPIGTVYALTVWDPDGDGPMPAQLVAGGSFSEAGSTAARNIARWDGTQWLPFGSGIRGNGIVYSLTTWDPDGDGPLPAQLVAGGSFTTAGDVTVNSIARWDGTQWLPFGSGVSGTVTALTSWDPDGDGPLPPRLVAGGLFTTAGGVTVNNIAMWDGTQWLPLGSGVHWYSPQVNALITWDPDGDGPLPAQLVAGGNFTIAGGVTVNRIARWDGTQWHAFGPGLGPTPGSGGGADSAQVHALATWDPDGDGPLPAQLVAGGAFTTSGGATVNRLARWNGTQWLPFGSGSNHTVTSLTTWDPDGDGPLPAQLVAGGLIMAGTYKPGHLALWSTGGAPGVTQHPAHASVSPGDTITLTAAAIIGRPSVQWHRNGSPIFNGPGGASPDGGDGGVVWGATATLPLIGSTATLTITNAQPGDAGQYTAVFTNTCGSTTSGVAIVSVTGNTPACNPADIAATDGSPGPDGQVDNGDFLLFIASFFTGCDLPGQTPCGPADIAQTDAAPGPDGQIDTGDFLRFIASFFAGC